MNDDRDVKLCGACSGGVSGWLHPLVCDKPEGHDGGHVDSRRPNEIFAFHTFKAPEPPSDEKDD